MLDDFKKGLQERIEKNAIRVPGVSWEDRNGVVHTEDIILKRSFVKIPLIGWLFGDWARINPPLNDKNEILWVNVIFGGRRNLAILLSVMLVLAMLYFMVVGILGNGAEYLNGNKYVILNTTTFDKFCQTHLVEDVRGSWNGTAFESLNLTLQKPL